MSWIQVALIVAAGVVAYRVGGAIVDAQRRREMRRWLALHPEFHAAKLHASVSGGPNAFQAGLRRERQSVVK